MSGADTDADATSGSDAANGPLEGEARESGARDRAGTLLERVRTEPRPHAVAVGLALVAGLVLAWLHWLGLVAGGALVALTAPSVRRGVVGALGFGAVVLVAFALSLDGTVGTVLEMTPVVYLVVASAFGLPALGSLVRGIV